MELFLITVAKYIFLILTVAFMYQNVKFIYGERYEVSYNIFHLSNRQFIVNLMFILVAGFVSLVVSENPAQSFLFYVELLGVFIVGKILLQRIFKYGCPILFNNMLFLTSIGLIMLNRIDFETAHAQLVYSALGIFAMVLVFFAMKLLKDLVLLRYLFLAVSIMFLILPFFYGVESYGSLNWARIYGFAFQPSEIVKLTYCFFLATYFAKEVSMKRTIISIAISVGLILILVVQNDFGASLMFFTLFMMIMYTATGSIPLFALGYGATAVASLVAYQFIGHIQTRVEVWQNPFDYPLGQGYQVLQSMFAITSYAPFGTGFYNGTPSFIPVVESDMIYSIISEEFGIIVGLMILSIYIIMFYRGIHIALRVRKKEYSYIALGLTVIFLFQTCLIIGGVTKFIPLTGVTMPFVSYGGTSFVVSSMLIGVLQFIHQYSLLEDSEEHIDGYYDEEYVDYE